MPKYCDHGVYGQIGVTPTWGQAQEGDGLSVIAGSPATVSINLASASASSGSFSLFGVTVSCSGSGATLVSSIVNAINTSSTPIQAMDVGWSTPQLRDAVYARVGSPTTTLEIMTRAASATYNSKPIVTSGFTGGTFGPYAFSGATSGAWGTLFNESTSAFASGIILHRYGLWCTAHNKPIAGAILPDDLIYVRSGKILTSTMISDSRQPTLSGIGTLSNPVRFRIDNGSIWSDGVEPVLHIRFHQDNFSPGINFSGGKTWIIADKYSDSKYGLKLSVYGSGSGNNWSITIISGGGCIVEGLDMDGTLTTVNPHHTVIYARDHGNEVSSFVLRNCRTLSKTSSPHFIAENYDTFVTLINHDFSTQYTSAFPYVLDFRQGFAGRNNAILDACKFTGFVANSNLMQNLTGDYYQKVTFRNTQWGNVSIRGPYVSGQPFNGGTGRAEPYVKVVSMYSQIGNRDFMIDAPSGTVEWNSSRSYPFCNAKLLDGVTGWSILATPTSVSGLISATFPLHVPRISKINTLGSGNKTATIEIAAHENLTVNSAFISARFEYTDSSDVFRVIDTHSFEPSTLPSSTATWSDELSGQVNYPFTAQKFNKYKLQVQLPSVKDDTEVACFIFLHNTVANTSYGVFIDPEIILS